MKIREHCVISDPPKKDIESFDKFIELVAAAVPDGLFFPNARGTKRRLVPPPRKNPCDLCDTARYNKLCSKSKTCAPMLYFTMAQVTNASLKTFTSA